MGSGKLSPARERLTTLPGRQVVVVFPSVPQRVALATVAGDQCLRFEALGDEPDERRPRVADLLTESRRFFFVCPNLLLPALLMRQWGVGAVDGIIVASENALLR